MKLRDITICPAENGYTVTACYEREEEPKEANVPVSMYDDKKYVVEEKDNVVNVVKDLLDNKSNFKEDALKAMKKDESDEEE